MRERSFWTAKGRRLAIRRNVACWLDIFVPSSCAIGLFGAGALLVARLLRFSQNSVWLGIAIASFLGAIASWWFARRRFFTLEDGLTRLDHIGGLHNRLSAARVGVGSWPRPRELRDDARWHWLRLIGPIGLALLVLIGAAYVKVPHRNRHEPITEQPLAWVQIESWLKTLQESQLIQAEALKKLGADMDELRQQLPENWYNQSSLEASDTLREKTEQALRSLRDDLHKTEDALAAGSTVNQSSSSGELKMLNESLQKALHGLEMGNLPLNKELLSNLRKLDLSKVKQLDASQLAKLREKLKSGVRVCEKCVGPSVRAGKEIAGQAGGTGGGGKSAPLTAKQAPTDLHTKETDTVSNTDLSRATIGDVSGVDKAEHTVKKTAPKQPVSGGVITSAGTGGEAVWRDSLTPEEREVLQRFFK